MGINKKVDKDIAEKSSESQDLVLEGELSSFSAAVNDVIDLGIDWKSLDKKEIFEKLAAFDSAGDMDLFTCEVPSTSGGKLELRFSKYLKGWEGSDGALRIDLTRPEFPEDDWDKYYVGTFDFAHIDKGEKEEWDMKHRETGNLYRKQGIAGEILKLFEEYVAERPKSQEISSEVSQPDLIDWLEKRGYSAATVEDEEKLERVPDLQIFSSPKGEKYLFDVPAFREKFGFDPSNPELWNSENYKEDFFYMKSSFRIKFKKTVS